MVMWRTQDGPRYEQHAREPLDVVDAGIVICLPQVCWVDYQVSAGRADLNAPFEDTGSRDLLPFSDEDFEQAELRAAVVVIVTRDMAGQEKILCIQRAVEPAAGHWSVPGGKVEFVREARGIRLESAEEAAAREANEETLFRLSEEEISNGDLGAFIYEDSNYYVAVFRVYVEMDDPRIMVVERGHNVANVAWVPVSALRRGEDCFPRTQLLDDVIMYFEREWTAETLTPTP